MLDNIPLEFLLWIIVLEIVLGVLVIYLSRDFQWILRKKDECPIFEEATVNKIVSTSFDEELGWVKRPNSFGYETIDGKKIKCTIDHRGSRANAEHEGKQILISTYGDSYTFCREVMDNQTWQAYLSKKTNTNVLNFGIGNYGADQALLRLKREFKKNKSEIVILTIVPETIARILSSWKHYFEYGNIYGFKPRFELNKKQLQLIQNPCSSENCYKKPNDLIRKAKKHDYFYRRKFQKDVLSFPLVYSLFKNPARNVKLLFALLLRKINNNYQLLPNKIVLEHNDKIIRELYTKKEPVILLERIIKEFKGFVEENNSVPVLMILPYQSHAKNYSLCGDYYYKDFVSTIVRKLKIQLINPIDVIANNSNTSELYASDAYGSHLSPKGNLLVSNYVYDRLSPYIKRNENEVFNEI